MKLYDMWGGGSYLTMLPISEMNERLIYELERIWQETVIF
jgi:hypothetical protein